MKFGYLALFSASLFIAPRSAEACTSWVIRPEVSASGMMIIQKVLDERYTPHLDADIRVAPNGWRWIRIGRLNGPSMAMNEKGVAITANCGERNGDETSRKGRQTFYSFELLWHVVRNCATAEAGVRELKHIGRNRLFRMPGNQLVKYGTILMVADAKRAFMVEIGDGYCMIKNFETGEEWKEECDCVVNGIGFVPNDQFAAVKAKNLHRVGTCVKWGALREVIWSAWDVAMTI